jgi:hypothetical protein
MRAIMLVDKGVTVDGAPWRQRRRNHPHLRTMCSDELILGLGYNSFTIDEPWWQGRRIRHDKQGSTMNDDG